MLWSYWVIYTLVFIVCLLLLVAFLTLFERKLISAIQQRNGPDSTGWLGVLQPLSDAVKLLLKEFVFIKTPLFFVFFVSPIFSLIFGILNWLFIPLNGSGSFMVSFYGLLWLFCLSSLHVYSIFMSGVSSASKYAYLGSIRSVIQLISYEVTLAFVVMPVILISGSFNLSHIVNHQIYVNVSNYVIMIPVAVIFFICMLAETGRAPFDLPEAEAELVAGYNVEYSSLFFAFFFLGEYLNLFFMSMLFSILFFSGWGVPTCTLTSLISHDIALLIQSLILIAKSMLCVFCVVWVRATLPRVRYDSLMTLCWKNFLLFTVSFFFFFICFYTLVLVYV